MDSKKPKIFCSFELVVGIEPISISFADLLHSMYITSIFGTGGEIRTPPSLVLHGLRESNSFHPRFWRPGAYHMLTRILWTQWESK